jgi:hypothetical protein
MVNANKITLFDRVLLYSIGICLLCMLYGIFYVDNKMHLMMCINYKHVQNC